MVTSSDAEVMEHFPRLTTWNHLGRQYAPFTASY